MSDDPTNGAKADASYKLPEGFKDESEFIQDARTKFQQGIDFDRENREQGLEDLKFLAGEQWDTDAKAARKGRPMLTINRLPQFVAQVVGDIRINRPSIKVRPAEDGDKDLAEIREGLIRSIERESDAPGVYANAGTNQVGCGIGNYRIALKYATADGFDRDIGISTIPNAFAVVWDPMSTERTGKDADYCFVSDEMPRKAFEKSFPDQIASGLEVPQHDTNGWYTKDTVRVTEYWLVKQTPVKLALMENGDVLNVKDVPRGSKPKRTRTAVKRSACMYLITGKAILAGPFEMPIDRVPIIRVQGWEINVGDKRIRWGLVRFARDPQRLQNYWRSISAEMLALAPKGKWLAHETTEGDSDELRLALSNDDNLLVWTGQTAPVYVPPPTLNVAVLQESALNAQDMKDVTGLHDASLGAQSNETSGKAIIARERQGDTATYIYHDNLQAAIEAGGDVINQLIPEVYDTARTVRVLGEDEAVKVQRINDPNNPESKDINRGRYDIAIETGPSYSTRRVEAAESMMQFVQAVPAAAQVAGDLIAKAQDWPLAEQIGDRLKKTLPPQVTDGEDEDLSPEEKAAKEQQQKSAQDQQAQQQQMQQRGIEAEIATKEAQAKKTSAEAAKIGAEAQAAGHDQGDPQMAGLDLQLKAAQVRKENALADEAEANARLADFKAQSAGVDLTLRPLEAAHSAADLNIKLNPPEPAEAEPQAA